MKMRNLSTYLLLTALLLNACGTTQTSEPATTQTLDPTSLPVIETMADLPADTPQPATEVTGPEVIQLGELTLEIYELVKSNTSDNGNFNTTAGPSSEILKTRRPLRDVFAQAFSPPPLNGRQLKAVKHEVDGELIVTFSMDEEEVLSVNAGDVSPVTNLRGMWVIGEDWIVEVAHTENQTNDNVITTAATGEIFMNGVSLNEQFGYDETFGFQPLNEKPFYFFSKDGEIGISYAGEVSMPGFESVGHYACCSGAAFNPKAYLTMVTFFGSKGKQGFYVELGRFSDFNLGMLDLSGAGLTVDAFELQDGSWPDEENHQARPAGSLPGWVMERHEMDRKNYVKYPDLPLFEGKVLNANTVIDGTLATVEVKLDDTVVLSVPAGDLTYSAAMDLARGVWVHEADWYMEMAHIDGKTEGNVISITALGEIFRSGESLSVLNGYDETFGFQVMAGKPFFFFKKDGEFGLNHGGEEVMLGFDEIAHYYCCGFSVYNPTRYENMVAFFASKDGVRYYVEAGVFE